MSVNLDINYNDQGFYVGNGLVSHWWCSSLKFLHFAYFFPTVMALDTAGRQRVGFQ